MTQDKGKLVHSHPANELTEKLFGFESVINKTKNADADAANFHLASDAVPTGKIWKITYVAAWNEDGNVGTGIILDVYHDATLTRFYREVAAVTKYVTANKLVEFYLDAGDYIEATFITVTIGNTCYLNIFGYEMNAP